MEEFYWLLVALLAVIYSFSVRLVQKKLGIQEKMVALQKEMNELNRQLKEAQKKKDEKKMNELMKKQMEMMPMVSKAMFSQLAGMVPILLLFFGFMFLAEHINPYTADDIIINTTNSSCIFYHIPENANSGEWVVYGEIFIGNKPIAKNTTLFFVSTSPKEKYLPNSASGELFLFVSDNGGSKREKNIYFPGDDIKICAKSERKFDRFSIKLDRGTRFYVELPFTIPIFNVNRIYGVRGWFILNAIVLGLLISKFTNKREKATGLNKNTGKNEKDGGKK